MDQPNSPQPETVEHRFGEPPEDSICGFCDHEWIERTTALDDERVFMCRKCRALGRSKLPHPA